jgi:tetratricopeptide (TPR) repeat protein
LTAFEAPNLRRSAWAFALMICASCTPALASPFYADVSATRALLLFRLGDYDKSIADYDASLKIAPKNAFALYGRGIDELRKQKAPEGQADIAQAIALSLKIADSFDRHGIAP